MTTISNAHIGIAGVHHVAAVLSIRGMVALPTVRNTAGFDIVVTHDTRHAFLQVKTTTNPRATSFPMPAPEHIRTSPNDYYVLVRQVKGEERFDCFLVSGAEARREVERTDAGKRAAQRQQRHRPYPWHYVARGGMAQRVDQLAAVVAGPTRCAAAPRRPGAPAAGRRTSTVQRARWRPGTVQATTCAPHESTSSPNKGGNMSESAGAALLSLRFALALQFANEIHGKQARKGLGVPYISHLMARPP